MTELEVREADGDDRDPWVRGFRHVDSFLCPVPCQWEALWRLEGGETDVEAPEVPVGLLQGWNTR